MAQHTSLDLCPCHGPGILHRFFNFKFSDCCLKVTVFHYCQHVNEEPPSLIVIAIVIKSNDNVSLNYKEIVFSLEIANIPNIDQILCVEI